MFIFRKTQLALKKIVVGVSEKSNEQLIFNLSTGILSGKYENFENLIFCAIRDAMEFIKNV
jgi:arginine deiminase